VVLLFCCSLDSCSGSTRLVGSTFDATSESCIVSLTVLSSVVAADKGSTKGVLDTLVKCLPLIGSIKGSKE